MDDTQMEKPCGVESVRALGGNMLDSEYNEYDEKSNSYSFNSDGILRVLSKRISIYDGTNPKPKRESSILDVLGDIKSSKYSDLISTLRNMPEGAERKDFKDRLPSVTFAGTFSYREMESVTATTGFIIPDIDHIDVTTALDVLRHDPYVWFAFRSPSGDGIKCGIRTSGIKNDDNHKALYFSVERYFLDLYQIKIDPSCKDIGRLTYLTHDPDIFINHAPIDFDVEAWREKPSEKYCIPPEYDSNHHDFGLKILNECCREIAQSEPGQQHYIRLKMAVKVGGFIATGFIQEETAIAELENAVIASGAKDIRSAMKTVSDGIRYGKLHPIEPLRSRQFNSSDETVLESWDDPIPLNCDLLPVIPFNPDWLPEPCKDAVINIAHRQQSSIDYLAIAVMICMASLLGKKVAIRPKHNDDWPVIANLFGCAIGRPSAMKTPALQEIIKPIHRLESESKKVFDEDNRNFEISNTLREMKNDDLKKKAAKSVKSGDAQGAFDILTSIESEGGEPPTRKRYVINDTSIEKLGEILSENPNGVLVFRDELFGFLKTINREDRANDRAFYLECWAGTGRYSYDRISRGTLDIENCIVSLLGCLTPSKIIPLVNSSMYGGIDDDGFLQRFQLMVYPDDVEYKYIDEKPDVDALESLYGFFDYISSLQFSLKEYEKIPTVCFSPEAQEVFAQWITDLQAEIASPDIHPAIESHLAKYRSLVPSLALLIHVGGDDIHGNVSNVSLQKAIQWGKYLKSHALRVYGMAINNSSHLGKLLLDKIKAKKVSSPFSARDVKRAQWHGLTAEGAVETAIKTLIENGYIQKRTTPANNNKDKTEFLINPKIFSESA